MTKATVDQRAARRLHRMLLAGQTSLPMLAAGVRLAITVDSLLAVSALNHHPTARSATSLRISELSVFSGLTCHSEASAPPFHGAPERSYRS
jgi:hypothetical protein